MNIKALMYASFMLIMQSFCINISMSETTKQQIEQQPLSFSVNQSTTDHAKINCLLLCSSHDEITNRFAKILKFDLEFSDQLNVEINLCKKDLDESQTNRLFEKNISLCLHLKQVQPSNQTVCNYNLTLEETGSRETLFARDFQIQPSSLVTRAHTISSELIPLLTHEQGICLSSLSYCKQFSPQKKVVCIADYTCFHETVIDPGNTINVAPSWHTQAPILFYSQFTKVNGNLVSYNLQTKKQQVICSYDGLSMQPSFSPDGSRVALCMTSTQGNSEIYLYDRTVCKKFGRRIFQQLTHNGGNNASPCLLPNNDLIFCSDFQTGNPQLYYLNKKKNLVHRLSNGTSYCAAPSYNHKNHALVYTRSIHGTFQLFMMTFSKHGTTEKQLTFSSGDKVDPTWSPSGSYVAFVHDTWDEQGKKIPQIASLNIKSGIIRILTSDQHPKSFPAWTEASYYQLS